MDDLPSSAATRQTLLAACSIAEEARTCKEPREVVKRREGILLGAKRRVSRTFHCYAFEPLQSKADAFCWMGFETGEEQGQRTSRFPRSLALLLFVMSEA
jgi:hypothetical protein